MNEALKILVPVLERAIDSLDDLRIALAKPLETMATIPLSQLIERLAEKLPPPNFPEYMNTEQAAEYLGVSTQYLEIARHKRRDGPPYISLGGKGTAIRYSRTCLDLWMEQHRRTHTGEAYARVEGQND